MTKFNTVTLIGYVGVEPEVKKGKGGKPYCRFSVAAGANQEDKATWVRCVIFGDSADRFAGMVTKGTMVLVHGYLESQEWRDKDGIQHSTLGVIVTRWSALRRSLQEESPVPEGMPF